MPELPDVEAVRRYLLSQDLVGRTIAGAEVLWPKAVRTPDGEELGHGVSGRTIGDIRRRAKFLVLDLAGSPRRHRILHLRMTGSLLVHPAALPRPQYTRNVLLLDREEELRFVDPRKFGTMWLVEDPSPVLSRLGPEPLDAAFTPDVLAQRLGRREAPVKALLCDQAVIAGIGNIYADEVLFLAGIGPLKKGSELSPEEVERLHRAIVDRLPEATEVLAPLIANGVPPSESEGAAGLLLMPRSAGEACGRCGTPVTKMPVRGRSTYFCPRCQPE